ncbi:hypothetical protein [Streptomyces sp. HUAS TT20]|uniref:hypothetical protein n=1 Tax=Streptomyces sp. HUAS TT20 TaxID=3447509 RepID=UPI0021DA3657|nr:hypothetical protein [Streptomyces sp. HUAS 15-9]UXY32957.1 hypothetical protein N8I87_42350 [Streptomyces sp. HUAS 15-9]
MTTQHPTSTDFTQAEIAEYRSLVTGLLAACRRVADQHSPGGAWAPSSHDLPDQFGEAMGIIADLSRVLNGTRHGMRRIHGRARERLHNSAASSGNGRSSHPWRPHSLLASSPSGGSDRTEGHDTLRGGS